MTVLAAIWAWFVALDPRIWQAVVAGAFVASGWLVNGRQNRLAAQRLRDEKLRDMHRAIYAEIDTNLANLGDEETLDASTAEMAERMQDDDSFVPLIPKERHDRLFDTVKSEIHVLPRVTIDPIVRYYSLQDTISALIEDMRSESYAKLPVNRRMAIYSDYIAMKKQALIFGKTANYLIKVFAEKGKEGAEAEAARLNRAAMSPRLVSNPASDRSAT